MYNSHDNFRTYKQRVARCLQHPRNNHLKKSLLLKRFLKNPAQIGSLYPSSSALCQEMISGIDIESAAHVVELGPGTGVITSKILTSMNHNSNFIAIELDAHIYKAFKKHLPLVKIYNDSAVNLSSILKDEGILHVDAIVSGLPWAAFTYSLQKQILSEVIKNLSPDGYFTTFAYVQGALLPSARRFKKLLNHSFANVETSEIVWNNIPPAFVYRCRK